MTGKKEDTVSLAKTKVAGTIANDDLVSLLIDDVQVNESDPYAEFTVRGDKVVNPGSTVTFFYETSDGTARGISDFKKTRKKGAITEGQGISIRIPLKDDQLVEEDEFFEVIISDNSENSSIKDGKGRATITDNDYASLSINDVAVGESKYTAVFTVNSDKEVTEGTSIVFHYATASASAEAQHDF